jgi:hypothetical protein
VSARLIRKPVRCKGAEKAVTAQLISRCAIKTPVPGLVTVGHPVSQARIQSVLWHHNRTGHYYYRYQMAGEGG